MINNLKKFELTAQSTFRPFVLSLQELNVSRLVSFVLQCDGAQIYTFACAKFCLSQRFFSR